MSCLVSEWIRAHIITRRPCFVFYNHEHRKCKSYYYLVSTFEKINCNEKVESYFVKVMCEMKNMLVEKYINRMNHFSYLLLLFLLSTIQKQVWLVFIVK